MGKIIHEYLIGNVVFWVCLCTSLVLLGIGFLLPPMGDINPSILKAVGELFGFATLAVVSDALKRGYDAKIQHGDTTIEITDNDSKHE